MVLSLAIKPYQSIRRPRRFIPLTKSKKQHKIQHRTIKFKHPWTNGMVENFNKRVRKNVLTKYRFQTVFELNGKLLEFVDDYNQNKRLKSLDYKTPAQYLKEQKNITLQRIII
jgi:transposase InsO family protein